MGCRAGRARAVLPHGTSFRLSASQLCNIAAGDDKGGDAAILRQGAEKKDGGAIVVRQGKAEGTQQGKGTALLC